MPVTTHIIDVTAQASADLLSCIAETVYFIVVKFVLVNLLGERTIICTEICSMIHNACKSVFVHILVGQETRTCNSYLFHVKEPSMGPYRSYRTLAEIYEWSQCSDTYAWPCAQWLATLFKTQ